VAIGSRALKVGETVMVRLVVKTRPSQQYRVSRELRSRLKAAFPA